ncbi:MAG: hypothetical protein R8G33_03975 [Gammaproteobacteria bacterium]|nr:hypothetical protein [Gammaproteobacteria bacterium]
MTYKADRRHKERRLEREFVEFPLKNDDGEKVLCDRRKNVDRRSKIIVTSEFISDAQFAEYFKHNDE